MKAWELNTLILAILLILGCSSDKAVRPPSAESLKVKDTIEILSSLNKAYENRDPGAFMRHIYRDPSYHSLIEEGIKRDFAAFERISLNLTPRWARYREDSLQLSVHWEGNWYDSEGKAIRYRGNSIFSFKDKGELNLIRIEGDSPFGITGE